MSEGSLRGCDPDDDARFRGEGLSRFQRACSELEWLLSRGYAPSAASALVGDRHGLDARGRSGLLRSVAPHALVAQRNARRRSSADLTELNVDGFNLLVTLEVAFSGGPILLGRDGALRDLAGLRGSYKLIESTHRALGAVTAFLETTAVKRVRWYFDAPVSHAGDLASQVRATSASAPWETTTELVKDPDVTLAGMDSVVSSDARVIDGALGWVSLAREVAAHGCPDAWVVRAYEELHV